MALIGKIREKSWLLVLIVGLALLAFILTDYKSFLGGSDDQLGYGTIDGEMVNPSLYNAAVENYTAMDRQSFAQQQREFTSKDAENSKNKAWKAIVDSVLLQREFNALGISVSENEFDAYLFGQEGFSVLPDIQNAFKDPQTGLFSQKLLEDRIEQMKSSSNPEEILAWENSKKSLTIRRQQEKYFGLLQQGVYATKLEAENSYMAKEEVKSISFVMKRMTDIKDEDVKISDEELKAFYDEHKEESKYKVKTNTRELRYFDIVVEPSAEDSSKFYADYAKLKSQLEASTSIAKDSALVMANSEMKFFSRKLGYRKQGEAKAREGFTYPAMMDSVFSAASIGTVIGPYQDGPSYRLAKVIGREGKLLSARHILISAQRNDSAAVAKAKKTVDSLMLIINKDNFESLVAKHSSDPGSNTTGGKYEDFTAGEMVPEFSNFASNEPIGKIGYVQTDYGFHIMEALGRKDASFPVLAVIQKSLNPSSETIDLTKSKAYEMLDEVSAQVEKEEDPATKIAIFDSLARTEGYFARSLTMNEDNLKVYGMNTTYAENKMIELGFSSEFTVGDFYPSPIKDDDRYVIAILKTVRNEGTPDFESSKEIFKKDLMTNKKADKIKSLMAGKKLDQIEKGLNLPLTKAEVTFANPQISGGGYEPEVVGMLFSGLKDGQTTLPVQGKTGVYVIRIDKTTKAPVAASYDEEKSSLISNTVSNITNEAVRALTEKANVIDNRRFNEVGIRK